MNRILLTVAGVSLALVVVAAVSALTLRSVIDKKDDVISQEAAAIVLVEDILATDSRSARKTRSFLLTGQPRFLDERNAARATLGKQLNQLGQMRLHDDERALLDRIRALDGQARVASDALVERRRAGASAEMLGNELELGLQPIRDELDAALDALKRRKQANLDDAMRASDDAARRSFAILGVTTMSALVFASVLGLMVARAWRQLLQASQFQERVMAIVSHDLRSPLAAILASASHARRRPEATDVERGIAERIIRSAKRIEGLTRLILDFTRTRMHGGLPVVPVREDLHAIVRGVVDELREAFPDRVIELKEVGNGRGELDRDRIGQVVGNLVDNAIRYSAPETPVLVESRGASDELLEIVVHNSGPPIDPKLLPFIFEPFRAGSTLPTVRESHGLGLFVVHEVVRGHGGTIRVVSNDGGTTFTVQLPRGFRSKDAKPGDVVALPSR